MVKVNPKKIKRASTLASVLVAPALSFLAFGLHAEEAAVTASPPVPQRNAALQPPAIPHFEIVRFDVEGNTLLPTAALEQLFKPYTGKQRDFGDVQRAQEALENAYRILGYSVVRVALPEQELDNGVVRFKVTETRIGKVTVEGSRAFDEANIRRSLPGLRAGEAPNMAAISRSLKVANENPSRKTNLQLQDGEKDGEIDALLKVADEKTWGAGVSFDNTGDANTGRNRMNVLLQNANLGGLDHVASLQYTTSLSHPHDVGVYGFGYHVPLYRLGDSIDVFGSYSNVDSGTVSAGLFDLLVSGKGTTLGSRYNHNFDRVGNYESKLIGGLDYKAFKNSVSLQGIPLGNDITVHPLSLTYSGTHAAGAEVSDFYVSGVGNLPGGDHGGSSDFAQIRSGAPAAYTMLRYGANFSRAFAGDWQLRFVFNGQSTNDALVPSEQIGAGGATTVRGFEERAVANDSGRVTNLELYTPNLCGGIHGGAAQCRLLTFYDNGVVTRNHALPGEQQQASIGSIGVGLRMNVERNFALQLDLARVVDAADNQPRGSQRVHFKMAFSY